MKSILKTFLFFTAWWIALCGAEWCPRLFHKRSLELDVNPAFLNADEYYDQDGEKSYGLTISSFLHYTFRYNNDTGMYVPNQPPFAPDQVGRIEDILHVDDFDFATEYEKLTGPKTTWPNDARRIPDDVLPFEGIIVPQGFHLTPTAGRLSIINLDDENRTEYIVHESTFDPPFDPPFGVDGDEPRFFHKVIFYDMDGDGLRDIVTVRSGFKLPPFSYPPFSELVYYKNPGDKLDPKVEWEETILYGDSPSDPFGPDICLAMHDFDGDGTPEIVATHFFSGDNEYDDPLAPPTKGKIVMYGAPFQGSWGDVNASNPPRVKLIDDSQGFPFGIEIVDLNGNGKMEILATNHQPNCMPFLGVQGRVYALEQPASGNVYDDNWTVHVLLDGILPQPTPAGARGMRLAPGHAIPFFPNKQERNENRPWILLSGDQAGKVWVMKPSDRDFEYETAVVFDINDYYGDRATQTYTSDGLTVSTIGEPAIFYTETDEKYKKEPHGRESMSKKTKHGLKGSSKATERTSLVSMSSTSEHMSTSRRSKGKESSSKGSKAKSTKSSKSRSKGSKGSVRGLKVLKRNFSRNQRVEDAAGIAEIYIPVFEAKEIHVLSFDGENSERVNCPSGVIYACT